MFTAQLLESIEAKVALHCLDGQVLEDILKFIYTAEIQVDCPAFYFKFCIQYSSQFYRLQIKTLVIC